MTLCFFLNNLRLKYGCLFRYIWPHLGNTSLCIDYPVESCKIAFDISTLHVVLYLVMYRVLKNIIKKKIRAVAGQRSSPD